MALPMLRRCHRTSLTASFSRLIVSERTLLNHSCKTRLPSPSLSAVVTAVRPYSSDRDGMKQNQKVFFVGIPNPFIWLRTRIYYFLIKTYFDKDFTIEDFTEGAKQVSIMFCSGFDEEITLFFCSIYYLPQSLVYKSSMYFWI